MGAFNLNQFNDVAGVPAGLRAGFFRGQQFMQMWDGAQPWAQQANLQRPGTISSFSKTTQVSNRIVFLMFQL